MRHPASSYVQGINDLATPLFAVFLGDYYDGEDVLDGSVMVVLSEERLDEVRVILCFGSHFFLFASLAMLNLFQNTCTLLS
jgi:hypothetical protein